MSSWIYSKDGREYGPMNSSKIADAVLAQRLDLDDYVLCTKTQLWKRIREIKEIMDIIHSPVPGRYFQDIDFKAFENELGTIEQREQQPFQYFSIAELIFWQFITLGLFGFYWLLMQNSYLYQTIDVNAKKHRSLLRFALGPFAPFIAVIRGIENHKTLNEALVPSNSLVGILILRGIFILSAALMVVLMAHQFIILTLRAVLISFLVVLIPTQTYINNCHEKLKIPHTKKSFGFYLWMIFLIAISWLLFLFVF